LTKDASPLRKKKGRGIDRCSQAAVLILRVTKKKTPKGGGGVKVKEEVAI